VNSAQAIQCLRSVGALLENGHFEYTTQNKHGREYVDKDMLFRYPAKVLEFGKELAIRISNCFHRQGEALPLIVVGASPGGAILAQWVAYHLRLSGGAKQDAMALFVEKTGTEGFQLRPAYVELVKGQSVIVVEDIINAGWSAAGIVHTVERAGGHPRIVASIWNRGSVLAHKVGVRHLVSLVEEKMEAYTPGPDGRGCPMCVAGVPLNTDRGHGGKR